MATSHCLYASFLYHRPCGTATSSFHVAATFLRHLVFAFQIPHQAPPTLADIRGDPGTSGDPMRRNSAAHASFVAISASSNQIGEEHRVLLLALLRIRGAGGVNIDRRTSPFGRSLVPRTSILGAAFFRRCWLFPPPIQG